MDTGDLRVAEHGLLDALDQRGVGALSQQGSRVSLAAPPSPP